MLFTTIWCSNINAQTVSFDGEKSTWHDGFARYDYIMDEATLSIKPFKAPDGENYAVGAPPKGVRRCVVVAPKKPAPGNPWSWRGCYWDHEPQTEVELLRRGFFVAYITPDPGKEWDAWYKFLTEKHGLSAKPAFLGMSKGGVNEYDWTTANPDKVSCIYADNPAIRPETFAKLNLLAKNDVPLLNVCGTSDFLLENTTVPIEKRYHEFGGRITVIIKEGPAHHPHSIRNPKIIADWIERNMKPFNENKPVFVDSTWAKSYYYSLENSYIYLKEEDTYATSRGPGFTPVYERYSQVVNSPWGVTGATVIVPEKVLPSKPWIFRMGYIDRDAAVDRELLAKGYHIVISPVTEQSGSVTEQWDALYKLLTDNGFSKKPVMEGNGPGAGEVYAWAEANPDKISAIYGENPIMRSLMVKTSLLDNVESLAKASVPLMHVCGGNDPWLEKHTRELQKRYKKLGGKITVVIKSGQGHFLQVDTKPVVDFIVRNTK
ncbi:MAG: alpha/beta hydrolase [Sphingobacteriaceae bacterium]|nr:MAG: alpha/beta hydrolase [Sphingobacteriaceae bacterium]